MESYPQPKDFLVMSHLVTSNITCTKMQYSLQKHQPGNILHKQICLQPFELGHQEPNGPQSSRHCPWNQGTSLWKFPILILVPGEIAGEG